jgi:PAS domain S-box-containing protein
MTEKSSEQLSSEIAELNTGCEQLEKKNKDLSHRLELLSSLLDNLPGIAFRCVNDADFTFTYASQGTMAILGYSPDQIVNVYAFRKLVHTEDRSHNLAIINSLRPGKNNYDLVYRMRTAWGEFRWILEQGTALFAEDGHLEAIDGLLTDITDQKEREIKLYEENSRLRFSINERHHLGQLIGKSKPMRTVYKRIIKAAGTNAPVIIHGESGTGKELAAKTIHDLSERENGPFIAVNCGAISENLLESEFFGHLRGSFSGAYSDREGFLAAANGGTLFLDEISEMSIPLQIKLLRVLDGKGFNPVGSNKLSTSNFRLISATNRDLVHMVTSGRMREDFYYRINTVPLLMPPLRDRLEDLPLLIDHFLKQLGEKMEEKIDVSPKFYVILGKHYWPGNVRELFNVVRRYITLNEISFSPSVNNSPSNPAPPSKSVPKATSAGKKPVSDELKRVERNIILTALEENQYDMERTAAALGISRRTLQRRVNKHNLKHR